MKRYQFITLSLLLALLIGAVLITQVGASPLLGSGAPTVVSYQGLVKDGGLPYTGAGYFKFALVDGAGTTSYWSNDGSSSGGSEPTDGVQLIVANGLFQVLLGDTDLTYMTGLPASVFSGTERYLRIWFSTEGSSYTLLSPDQRIAAVPYALQAEEAQYAVEADTLDGLDSTDLYTRTEVDDLLAAYDARIADLETKLASVSVSGDDLYFTGVNVHVRSGSGSTNGAVNGVGNLIVGYNESSGDTRTGSHNLVVGPFHSYSSFGGLIAGYDNTISGGHSSVSGGLSNTASAWHSSVSGGINNTASGDNSSVSGGRYNIASGEYSSVLGGGGASAAEGNEAWAHYSIVAGGKGNVSGDDSGTDRTVGEASAVLAGGFNAAIRDNSSVSGGRDNVADGGYSSVSGGYSNESSGSYSSVSGGRNNVASGDYSSVLGGGGDTVAEGNEAWAHYSVIGGGRYNVAGDDAGTDRTVGEASAVLAGQSNGATGDYSSISGGYNNAISGDYSSVSGGRFNYASGSYSSVSGGRENTASGYWSSVSGGVNNTASGSYSSVSGGGSNTASGLYSSVSGGSDHESGGDYDWRAGGLFEDF